MSSERIEIPYAFVKTFEDYESDDDERGTLLHAEAGMCRVTKEDDNTELEAKAGIASFKVQTNGLGLTYQAKAESASLSESKSCSMDFGDQTIDFKTELKAKGPSVGGEAELALTGIGAKLNAELASASSSIGVFAGKVGLAADTGVKLGLDGVELTTMGTGVSLWPHTGITFFGSGVSVDTHSIARSIRSWF